jgi:formate C-acetyltransferase
MKYQIGNYDELREELDLQYVKAVYHPDSGLDREAVSQGIRAIYEAEESAGTPFAVTRAKMLAFALENIRITVAKSDCFASVCEYNHEITKIQQERYLTVSRAKLGDKLAAGEQAEKEGLFIAHLDLSHTTPDWERILTLGIPGLLALAEQRFAEDPSPFTESVKIAYTALRNFALRFSRIALAAGREDVANMVESLTDHPPVTLQQALEISLLYREAQLLEGELVRSMGIFDRLYFPFYEHDIAAGTLTEELAEELLAIYFSRFHAQSRGKDAGTPFCFGGYLPDGSDNCNILTRLAWKAYRRLGLPDPKFALRVNPDTPDEALLQIAECLREGKTATVFANEIIARKMFLRNGKEEKDLSNFVPIGCYEPAIMGKELSCTMTGLFNFAKVLEKLMSDPLFAPETFDEVLERYLQLTRRYLAETMAQALPWERLWYEINPSPLLSGTMDECMTHGLDVSQAGTKYTTSGIMCAGIGTAVDSLAAIQYLVFDRKRVPFARLQEILAADWEGEEKLRHESAKRAPKWGCGDEGVDRIARIITDTAADEIERTPNAKGGRYQMGLWSIDWIIPFGERTGATPDGRHRGEVISKNTGSTIGCDREGVAGLIESVTKLDHTRFANGTVLDVMLPVSTVAGQEGLRFLIDVIRTFFARGGFFIHFNILSHEMLKEAQQHPENYRNLQIRLCGWNVCFVDLDETMQNHLIREAESKL